MTDVGPTERRKAAERDVTFMDRIKVSKIVKKLRDQTHLADVAKHFKTSKIYITYAEHMTKRINYKTGQYYEHLYLCPKAVIRNILAWGGQQ